MRLSGAVGAAIGGGAAVPWLDCVWHPRHMLIAVLAGMVAGVTGWPG